MPDGVNFAAVCVEIAKHLAPDAAVTSDAGNFSSFIHRYIGFRPGQNFLSSVVGAMGAGVPMAVAAAIRRPGKQAVGFVGDGGALMSGNEIATAMQYGAAPILIISDNKRYGTIGMHHEVRYPNRPYEAAVKLTNPDFAAWGRVFGAEGITISTEAEVEARHRPGLRGEGPAGGGPRPHLGRADERLAPQAARRGCTADASRRRRAGDAPGAAGGGARRAASRRAPNRPILARPAGADRRALCARRAHRHPGAVPRRRAGRGLAPAGGGGEPPRRRQRHRHRGGGARRAGRHTPCCSPRRRM